MPRARVVHLVLSVMELDFRKQDTPVDIDDDIDNSIVRCTMHLQSGWFISLYLSLCVCLMCVLHILPFNNSFFVFVLFNIPVFISYEKSSAR